MKTTNKPRFNTRQIMTRAWSMFKNRWNLAETFADCLRQVWATAKAYATNGKASFDWGVEFVPTNAPAISMADALAAEYAAGTNGRTYFGD
jgi:hypothetical protein